MYKYKMTSKEYDLIFSCFISQTPTYNSKKFTDLKALKNLKYLEVQMMHRNLEACSNRKIVNGNMKQLKSFLDRSENLKKNYRNFNVKIDIRKSRVNFLGLLN